MFFVWKFNPGLQDFEPIGAFSKREEGERFAQENSEGDVKAHLLEQSFDAFLGSFHRVRMGAAAQVLERLEACLTKIAPQEMPKYESNGADTS